MPTVVNAYEKTSLRCFGGMPPPESRTRIERVDLDVGRGGGVEVAYIEGEKVRGRSTGFAGDELAGGGEGEVMVERVISTGGRSGEDEPVTARWCSTVARKALFVPSVVAPQARRVYLTSS